MAHYFEKLVPIVEFFPGERFQTFEAEGLDAKARQQTAVDNSLLQIGEFEFLLFQTGQKTGKSARKSVAGAGRVTNVFQGKRSATEEMVVTQE